LQIIFRLPGKNAAQIAEAASMLWVLSERANNKKVVNSFCARDLPAETIIFGKGRQSKKSWQECPQVVSCSV
jgi:hypothetical protein